MLDSARESFCRGTLYVVATPIGNLADITLRALAALSAADVVCAEDTRVTGQLLKAYGIHARRLVSLREHNERSMAEQVVAWLAEGKIVVQVSDAGTPAVSDPGARLAEVVHRAGHPVSPVPGASAVIAALSASGVPDDRFAFYGFLPPKSGERRKVLTELVAAPHATVCYEAPHRLVDTLTDLVEVLGPERPVLLARELTKAFETLRQLPAGGLLDWVKGDPNQTRGEIVLVIAGVRPAAASDMPALPEEALRVLRILAAELPTKQAATLTAEITGENRKALYDAALALKAER
ncbi:16S rRNA (cytidine(1402)-2'-O)-methyltransferase [Gulbenkiania indica]|uniref:Ribosomal RNA small subunit methyltransferase I n=1 Tax=Gulbenkiania indica TaxID=375574 RepID=A0A0K6GTS3_9NEIS|nr:16S rRNA (cytidine(1402)-2'-O)-methyltransferase [Gulbenkiania indica]CUA81936.1 16S rRNA (cytidine(1402)-2'-O)-methyltransferase [Gulbenkiania indica]